METAVRRRRRRGRRELQAIEQAARAYEDGRTRVNAGSKLKRDAEKILKLIPDGTYGTVTLTREPSAKKVPDMDAIRELLIRQGLDVPMKDCSPSLTFIWDSPA